MDLFVSVTLYEFYQLGEYFWNFSQHGLEIRQFVGPGSMKMLQIVCSCGMCGGGVGVDFVVVVVVVVAGVVVVVVGGGGVVVVVVVDVVVVVVVVVVVFFVVSNT